MTEILKISAEQSQTIKQIHDLVEKLDFWEREKAALLLVLGARYLNKMESSKKDAAKLLSMAMDHALSAPYL